MIKSFCLPCKVALCDLATIQGCGSLLFKVFPGTHEILLRPGMANCRLLACLLGINSMANSKQSPLVTWRGSRLHKRNRHPRSAEPPRHAFRFRPKTGCKLDKGQLHRIIVQSRGNWSLAWPWQGHPGSHPLCSHATTASKRRAHGAFHDASPRVPVRCYSPYSLIGVGPRFDYGPEYI